MGRNIKTGLCGPMGWGWATRTLGRVLENDEKSLRRKYDGSGILDRYRLRSREKEREGVS